MTTLVIAPHADDEVLGLGGTMAKLAASGEKVVVAVLTGHGDQEHPLWPPEAWDVVRAECQSACRILGASEVLFRELPAACLDVTPAWQINAVVNEVIDTVKPSQIFIPFANDLHKDHGALAYATSVATRPYLALGKQVKRILAYETLSETHLAPAYLEPAFQPTAFSDISEFLDAKLEAFAAYKTQIQEDNMPRSLRGIRSQAHYRGCSIGVEAAEAFVVLREHL